MLPVIKPDGESTARRIVACSILLIPISLLPRLLGMRGLFMRAPLLQQDSVCSISEYVLDESGPLFELGMCYWRPFFTCRRC
jgi:hypothetical protein